MNKCFTLIAFFLISFSVTAQNNVVFVEAFGNGLFGSVNYERLFGIKSNISVRTGLGFYSANDFYYTLPVSGQYLFSLRYDSFIEIGFGYTWAATEPDNLFKKSDEGSPDYLNNYFASIGYRKHFGNNLIWKANFIPLITNNKEVSTPWFGISLGKIF